MLIVKFSVLYVRNSVAYVSTTSQRQYFLRFLVIWLLNLHISNFDLAVIVFFFYHSHTLYLCCVTILFVLRTR